MHELPKNKKNDVNIKVKIRMHRMGTNRKGVKFSEAEHTSQTLEDMSTAYSMSMKRGGSHPPTVS